MNQETISKLKNKLLEEKKLIEDELSSFAHKDTKVKDNWVADFPNFGDERTEQDENAKEVQEYENELGMEYALETRLQNINLALEKIEKENYGFCESCGKQIETERLETEPSARTHVKCRI